MRAHSINCFAYSKLLYRCNVVDIRAADVKYFTSQAKAFIYSDMLEKPQELVLHRSTEDGGLGLYHIQYRAQAALMCTFLQTAINPKFIRNHYHNALYRHYVLDEALQVGAIPPHFRGDFFSTMRNLLKIGEDLTNISLKSLYKSLVSDVLRGEAAGPGEPRPLRPLRCELASPGTDWSRGYRLARLQGLGPDLISFNLKMLWGILPCRARLARILPRIEQSPDCRLCGQAPGERKEPESMEHALMACSGNKGLPESLLSLLKGYQPGLRGEQVLRLEIDVDATMELPLVWLASTLLCTLWRQRLQGRVCAARIRSELEARCRLLREGKRPGLRNAFVLAEIALRAMFSQD
jgi:hypothetical protein